MLSSGVRKRNSGRPARLCQRLPLPRHLLLPLPRHLLLPLPLPRQLLLPLHLLPRRRHQHRQSRPCSSTWKSSTRCVNVSACSARGRRPCRKGWASRRGLGPLLACRFSLLPLPAIARCLLPSPRQCLVSSSGRGAHTVPSVWRMGFCPRTLIWCAERLRRESAVARLSSRRSWRS